MKPSTQGLASQSPLLHHVLQLQMFVNHVPQILLLLHHGNLLIANNLLQSVLAILFYLTCMMPDLFRYIFTPQSQHHCTSTSKLFLIRDSSGASKAVSTAKSKPGMMSPAHSIPQLVLFSWLTKLFMYKENNTGERTQTWWRPMLTFKT